MVFRRVLDPPPLVIRRRADEIRLYGFYGEKGRWYHPWTPKIEQQRAGMTGKRIPRLLTEVVDTQQFISLGWFSSGYDPLDL